MLFVFTLTVRRAILLLHKKSALPSDSLGVAHLIRAYQVNGHTAAKLDPLNMHVKESFPSRPSNTYPSSEMVLCFVVVLLRGTLKCWVIFQSRGRDILLSSAMLAVLGFIATDYFCLPGDMYSFEAIPKTIDAHDALLKTGPMYQLALWIGLFDIVVTALAVQAMG